jgi:Xaa-Pro dipeptidase
MSTATKILAEYRDTFIHILPQSSQFPSLSAEVLKVFGSACTHSYLLPALHLARLVKTPTEIELIRKANAISSRAHEVVMRLLGRDAAGLIRGPEAGLVMPESWRIEKQAEAEAVFVASCRREGSVHFESRIG